MCSHASSDGDGWFNHRHKKTWTTYPFPPSLLPNRRCHPMPNFLIHSMALSLQYYRQFNTKKGLRSLPSLIKPSRIQILKHYQHLISMGRGSQACGDPTVRIGGIVLVPVCLHLVGSDFTCMGAVCVPAAWVLWLLGKLNMLDDYRWPFAALQVESDYLPIAAPQSLDLCTDPHR